MRHDAPFFRLFPPPKFLTMPHAGLEISDDYLRCIKYEITPHGLTVSHYAKAEIPLNVIDSGEIKDEKRFTEILRKFVKDNKLSYVRVSLPEEKVYLFQTDIPSRDVKEITQHVEFKLEENVPLAAAEAVFYFDILPVGVTGNGLRASVSVASKNYVEKLLSILHGIGLIPMAFEVAPKSIAKAIIPNKSEETFLIVHMMNRKTGIYIVSGGVVCFSSTFSSGAKQNTNGEVKESEVDPVVKEIHRVHSYWATRADTVPNIKEVILVGSDVIRLEGAFRAHSKEGLPSVNVANVWVNAFDINKHIPAISHEESLEYAVAAGLALP